MIESTETYWYDENGIRTRKHVATATTNTDTLYPFPFYEVEGTTPTRYYLVNGQAVAFRTGTGSVTYLTRDQVGSVVMATANGSVVQQKKYYPYGNGRGGGDFTVDFNYTGQRKDGTGLLYYNARNSARSSHPIR